MNPEELTRLLQRRKEGKCSPEELNRLDNWFNQTSRVGEWNWTDDHKAEIKFQIRTKIEMILREQTKERTLARNLKIAATILLILSLGLYLGSNYINNNTQYTEITAAPGTTTEVLLGDGSKVILQAKSRLKFPKTFGDKAREVSLYEGEAFFDIAKDPARPFIVTTRNVSTKVLGTAFNIEFYRDLKDMSVTVLRGKVSVSKSGGNQVFLDPDQQVVINKASGSFRKNVVDAREKVSWTEGRIQLNNQTMLHAARILETKHEVKIRFASPDIHSIRFTATFDRTDSLSSILNDISRINQLTYTIKNEEVTFKRRKN